MAAAKWIWYPGDFEQKLAMDVMNRRYERDAIISPFWRVDDCWHVVTFSKKFTLSAPDRLRITADGEFHVMADSPVCLKEFDGTLELSAGAHELSIRVYNPTGLPCLKVKGKEIISDDSWTVTCHDHNFPNAESYDFTGASPNRFKLKTSRLNYISHIEHDGGIIYDFGKEMISFLEFTGLSGNGTLDVFYGESIDECMDTKQCELTDKIFIRSAAKSITKIAKAFRYVYIKCCGSAAYTGISALYEYLPLKNKGRFESSDGLLNKIYDIAIYTLALNSREFFLDGIKRDRWAWSGDAYQTYLMNYYSFADKDIVKRTTLALRGKEPTLTHLNHIMDYSFYWLMGYYDYFRYTGDISFINKYFDRFQSLLDFCESRVNSRGLAEGQTYDWVFVDWADLDNRGEVAAEQMLFVAAYKAAAEIYKITGRTGGGKYLQKAEEISALINKLYWNAEKGCYIYSIKEGKPDGVVTRHPNIFALLFDIADKKQQEQIINNVLLNDAVTKLKTPYMRFYELSALCKAGYTDYVIGEIREYWGGMVSEGATSFWEYYNPEEKGAEKYAMYGRMYGKSLCHAWGASPIYIFGRYLAGVEPSNDGKTFIARPASGGLNNFSAVVPVCGGSVEITLNKNEVIAKTKGCEGMLIFAGKEIKVEKDKKVSIKAN